MRLSYLYSIILGLCLLLVTNLDSVSYFNDFLSAGCCYTNGCCFEVSPKELTQLPDGSWIINSTQQHMPPAEALDPKSFWLGKTVFSNDGKFYRCACENIPGEGWKIFDTAHTRCLAIPMQGF